MNQWAAALTGQDFGGYQIGNCIGAGGFGLVFEAVKISTGASFAIKVLPPSSSAEAVAEFDGEGILLKKLAKRSGVITCIDSGTVLVSVDFNGMPVDLPFKYHILTLASGALAELVSDPISRAAMPWADRFLHWRGAILGVHQMHLSSVAHRDLKCENCLLMVSKGSTEIRIADLGRSKDFSDPPSLHPDEYSHGRGDARFAPPEHLWFQGGWTEKDFRNADLYGLGSLLVELATGHPMTALAMGSWRDARAEGARDRAQGVIRDLSVLRPRYRRAIEHVVVEMPPAVRKPAADLLRQLCDPVPAERQYKRMGRLPKSPDRGLGWLLRRADILIALEKEDRSTEANRKKKRSAS